MTHQGVDLWYLNLFSALTYRNIFVQFSHDLKWTQFQRPHHCIVMAFCTTMNNQKSEKQGKLSKLLRRRLKVALMITAFEYFCKMRDMFSMWTQCNVAFKMSKQLFQCPNKNLMLDLWHIPEHLISVSEFIYSSIYQVVKLFKQMFILSFRIALSSQEMILHS